MTPIHLFMLVDHFGYETWWIAYSSSGRIVAHRFYNTGPVRDQYFSIVLLKL